MEEHRIVLVGGDWQDERQHYQDLLTRIEVPGFTRLHANIGMNWGDPYLFAIFDRPLQIYKAYPPRLERIPLREIIRFSEGAETQPPQEVLDELLKDHIVRQVPMDRFGDANAFYLSNMERMDRGWQYILSTYNVFEQKKE